MRASLTSSRASIARRISPRVGKQRLTQFASTGSGHTSCCSHVAASGRALAVDLSRQLTKSATRRRRRDTASKKWPATTTPTPPPSRRARAARAPRAPRRTTTSPRAARAAGAAAARAARRTAPAVDHGSARLEDAGRGAALDREAELRTSRPATPPELLGAPLDSMSAICPTR